MVRLGGNISVATFRPCPPRRRVVVVAASSSRRRRSVVGSSSLWLHRRLVVLYTAILTHPLGSGVRAMRPGHCSEAGAAATVRACEGCSGGEAVVVAASSSPCRVPPRRGSVATFRWRHFGGDISVATFRWRHFGGTIRARSLSPRVRRRLVVAASSSLHRRRRIVVAAPRRC